jgi:hypothetical protein
MGSIKSCTKDHDGSLKHKYHELLPLVPPGFEPMNHLEGMDHEIWTDGGNAHSMMNC